MEAQHWNNIFIYVSISHFVQIFTWVSRIYYLNYPLKYYITLRQSRVSLEIYVFVFSILQLINTYWFLVHHCAAGTSSQCYWDELMLLKCELMLLKGQINTNTNKNGFLLPTKKVLKYSYLVSIIKKFYLCLRIFKVKFVTFTSIILNEEWYVSEKLFFALNKNKRGWCDYFVYSWLLHKILI